MPLRQRKRLQLPGLAEVMALLLAVTMVVPAVLWMRSTAAGSWDLAPGTVTRASVQHTHYNAEDTRRKVDCEYEYIVGHLTFRGKWSGFWPEAGSPNALLGDELGVLRPGYPIMVYYSESNPGLSSPHAPAKERQTLYAWVFALSCLVTGYYVFRVYPTLRGA